MARPTSTSSSSISGGARTHVNEVCATLNQVHKLQIGSELLEAGDTTYCYIADGGESLQIDYLA